MAETNRLIHEGYEAWMVLCTIPHIAQDELKVSIRLLKKIYKQTAGRVARIMRQRVDVESIRAFELTHSSFSGFHAHYHSLWFTRPVIDELHVAEVGTIPDEADDEEFDDIERPDRIDFDFAAYWTATYLDVARKLGVRVSATANGGELASSARAAANYITKGSGASARIEKVAQELALTTTKTGHAASLSRTMWEIFENIHRIRDVQDWHSRPTLRAEYDEDSGIWIEYLQATKGMQRVRATDGINLQEDEQENVDEPVELLRISGGVYHRLVRPSPIVIAQMLEAAEDKGHSDAVLDVLHARAAADRDCPQFLVVMDRLVNFDPETGRRSERSVPRIMLETEQPPWLEPALDPLNGFDALDEFNAVLGEVAILQLPFGYESGVVMNIRPAINAADPERSRLRREGSFVAHRPGPLDT